MWRGHSSSAPAASPRDHQYISLCAERLCMCRGYSSPAQAASSGPKQYTCLCADSLCIQRRHSSSALAVASGHKQSVPFVLTVCACAEDTAALHQQLHPDGASSALPAEASGILGTSFYISPEIANGWPQYDNKVDLYSLGVIAFELWHPFSTVMERVVVLRDLVERGVMPPSWPEAHPVVCTPYSCLP